MRRFEYGPSGDRDDSAFRGPVCLLNWSQGRMNYSGNCGMGGYLLAAAILLT